MSLEKRVVLMNDRIWAKVAIMEEHAAAMQSDLGHLKAEARLSVGQALVADTGGDLMKEQIYDLSTRLESRLDDLQRSQESMQSHVNKQLDGQQDVLADLQDAQEFFSTETENKFQAMDVRITPLLEAMDAKMEDLHAK